MKGLAFIIGKPKSAKAEEDEPAAFKAAPSDDSTLREYGKLALEAAKDGDVNTFTSALKGFVRCCGGEHEEEEDDE
jgi:hypothetical protein